MTDSRNSRMTGLGRVLVFFYGLLALAATGRSVTQILTKFDEAPVAYALSALAAVVYIVATVALVAPARTPEAARRWYRIAFATIAFELVGVLVVGTLSLVDAQLFPHDSVWSVYGYGYVFIPLVLPVLGLWWLRSGGRSRVSAVDERPVRGDR
ncbi:hypothetical protein BFL36_01380 [Clavibacter michiganensis]|uniref:Integral membrane protein n=1 Tax=Clavibacter michiganensis TaxID=28447 RepID=A0A251YW38_9MICO|nr:hypothetical protein [Clavibacter michiganensis]MBT1636904.1 hypothetical protein [Clavibacter michiganensis]OUE28451.1 hypothetical protein BFL36_01380 [Clavibacter michiganensis]